MKGKKYLNVDKEHEGKKYLTVDSYRLDKVLGRIKQIKYVEKLE